jgi:hypothetical protein
MFHEGDTIENVNVVVYEEMAQAAAHVMYALATRHIVEEGREDRGERGRRERVFNGSATNLQVM